MTEPTEMELRLARAGYETAISQFGALSVINPDARHCAWDRQTDRLRRDWVEIAGVMIRKLREPTPEMLTPIANLIAPDDVPEGVTEHPRRLSRCADAVAEAWGAAIDAASPTEGT